MARVPKRIFFEIPIKLSMGYPVLKESFFEEMPPSSEFFQKWKHEGPWSAELLPLYEWDGILFVACPMEASPEPQTNWCVVRTEAEQLQKIWEEWAKFNVAETTLAAAIPTMAIDDKLDLQIPKVDLDLQAMQSQMEASISQKPELTSAPEEGGTKSEILDLNLSGAAVPSENAAPVAPISLLNLKKADLPAPPVSEAPPLAPTAPAPEPVTPPPAPAPAPAVAAAPVAPAPVAPAASLKAPPPPPPPKAKATPAVAAASAPQASAKSEVTQTSSKALSKPKLMGPVPAFQMRSLEDFEILWNGVLQNFEHGMFLTFSKDSFLPLRWDSTLKPSGDPKASNVTVPSPFRITYRTQKSYHGYLVPNPITDEFFQIWNKGQYPEHLTASPVVIDDHVKGLLLAWGPKSADRKETLDYIEKAALSMAAFFTKRPDSLKVA